MGHIKTPHIRNIAFLCLFFLTGSFFQHSFCTGFSYQWAHPSPQGNTVYGTVFTDATHGWAVTGCGSILKTIDGGQTWALTATPDSLCNDLYDIVVSAQGTLIASGDHGRIRRSTDQGLTWQTMSYPASGKLYDLALVPGGGISAAGQNGSVLVSLDDGISWTERGPGGSGSARHHYWKSASEGYVVGEGLFKKTVDGGISWTQVGNPGFFGLNEIYFVSNTVGYAVGNFVFWKTINGGSTWTSTNVAGEPDYRFRTVAIDELHWFTVTNVEGGTLWETLNAGATWQLKFSYSTSGFMSLVKNGDRLVFSSDLGDVFYTDNGGTSIQNAVQNLAVFPSAPIMIIGKRPDGVLFANNQPSSGTNNGTFFRSDDEGYSWYLPNPSQGLRWVTDIQFFDNQCGVLGSYSDIRYTLNGGTTWSASTLPANFSLTNFALPALDRFFAGANASSPTGAGNLYKSSDHGATWEVVGGGLPVGQLYVTTIEFADSFVGYIACLVNNVAGIYKTTDGGAAWSFINQTGLPGFVSDMLWLDENTGLAAVPSQSASGIYRTTNGGLNWIRVSTTSARYFTRGAGENVAAVNPGATVFQESSANGLNWMSFSSPFNTRSSGLGSLQSMKATGNGYILGGAGNKLMVAGRIPATFNPGTTIVPDGSVRCYNAIQTIYVGGSGGTFTILSGGSATLIAGQRIIFQPGTHAVQGSYMHGYITTNGQYCGGMAPAMVTIVAGEEPVPTVPAPGIFRVYPNPSTGIFTIELAGGTENGTIRLEVMNIRGVKVLSEMMKGERKQMFSIASNPPGLYFIRILSAEKSETVKLIKL